MYAVSDSDAYPSEREAVQKLAPQPKNIQETGLSENFLGDLLCKHLHDAGVLDLSRLAERMVGRRQGGAAGTVDTLSDRELEVFRRMGEGHATKRIASDLGVSMKTVQEYQARIKEKLGLADATELMRAAVRWTEGVL